MDLKVCFGGAFDVRTTFVFSSERGVLRMSVALFFIARNLEILKGQGVLFFLQQEVYIAEKMMILAFMDVNEFDVSLFDLWIYFLYILEFCLKNW